MHVTRKLYLLFCLLYGCGTADRQFENPDKWTVPGDENRLRGKVKQVSISFTAKDTTHKSMYVVFNTRGLITRTNITGGFTGYYHGSAIVTTYTYYNNQHIATITKTDTTTGRQLSSDTVIQVDGRHFKQVLAKNGRQSLWDAGEGGDSSIHYNMEAIGNNNRLAESSTYEVKFRNGRQVSENLFNRHCYEYDEQGRTVLIKTFHSHTGKPSSTLRMFYSKSGIPDSIRGSDRYYNFFSERNRLDSQGNITEKITLRGSTYSLIPPFIQRWQYRCDTKGNWIQRVWLNEKDSVLRVENRQIEYWPD